MRLAARVCGEGADVVLIPSHGRGAQDFDDLAQRLAAGGYRAVALEPRGVGQSRGPSDGVTLHDLAADAALTIERLCSAPVHVVGHANGQRIARCLAADRPELVDRLVLLACGGKVPGDAEKWALYGDIYDPAMPVARRLKALELNFFCAGADASVWLDGWWQVAREIQDRANDAVPLDDWWHGGAAPMLVIQGEHDVVAPPANGRVLAAELGRRVTLADLPDAAHAMLPEQPEAIARLILSWLGRADAQDDAM